MSDGLIIGPKPSETIELVLAENSPRKRILAGLSWDKSTEDISKGYIRAQISNSISTIIRNPDMLGYFVKNRDLMSQKDDNPDTREEDDPSFDLDLLCYGFDDQGHCKDYVTPSAFNAIDTAEKIYHSGDDMDGEGDLDDEDIFIELKDADDHYNHFFFVIESDCMHHIEAIDKPHIRIADAMNNENILNIRIDQLPKSDQYALVVCQIFKKDGQWHLQNISEFTKERQNWSEYLKKYL